MLFYKNIHTYSHLSPNLFVAEFFMDAEEIQYSRKTKRNRICLPVHGQSLDCLRGATAHHITENVITILIFQRLL